MPRPVSSSQDGRSSLDADWLETLPFSQGLWGSLPQPTSLGQNRLAVTQVPTGGSPSPRSCKARQRSCHASHFLFTDFIIVVFALAQASRFTPWPFGGGSRKKLGRDPLFASAGSTVFFLSIECLQYLSLYFSRVSKGTPPSSGCLLCLIGLFSLNSILVRVRIVHVSRPTTAFLQCADPVVWLRLVVARPHLSVLSRRPLSISSLAIYLSCPFGYTAESLVMYMG